MEIMDTIKQQIEENPVILYMKGAPNQPQCGFSARTVEALMACGKRFAYVDVLSNPDRSGHVRVYEWSGTAWTQLGNDIDGVVAREQSGNSVSRC